MSVDVYLGLRALAGGRAVPRASKRHVYLAPKPFVVVGYHLPGDPGAPIGLLCGTRPDRPNVVAIGEPRDAKLRFERLADLAMELNGYAGEFLAAAPTPRGGRTSAGVVRVPPAPQLVVPNEATAQWLCDIMGRRLRYLPTEGQYAVHPGIPVAGAHLSFFAGQRVPGSSLVLPLAETLGRHWETGQMAALDANLATMLAWINNPDNLHQAENEPPAGPIPDPDWETKELSDAIKAYHQLVEAHGPKQAAKPMHAAVNSALLSAWHSCWEGLDLLQTLPQADHVVDRWSGDANQWNRHAERVRAGQAHFRRRPRQLQVFRHHTRLERLTANLDREMALDDPLIMANYVAAGDALSGHVVHVDITSTRPVLHIRPDLEFARPLGTELFWLAQPVQTPKGMRRPTIRLTVTDVTTDGDITLTVLQGAVRRDLRDRLPKTGNHIVLSPFGPPDYHPDTLPTELPWTHAETEEDE